MKILGVTVRTPKLLKIKPVYAHCDLPCGVYDPAQARIEAQSVLKIQEKYDSLNDIDKTRAIVIKEERAELVKRHLCVLWTDYFKPEHLEKQPDIHATVWQACKQASVCKHSVDPADGQELLDMVDAVAKAFEATKS